MHSKSNFSHLFFSAIISCGLTRVFSTDPVEAGIFFLVTMQRHHERPIQTLDLITRVRDDLRSLLKPGTEWNTEWNEMEWNGSRGICYYK